MNTTAPPRSQPALTVPDTVRLIIFDADGTLRRTTVAGRPCPHGPGEWELLPRVRETLSAIDWSAHRLGIASNQDQIAYGWLSAEMARQLFTTLIAEATDGRTEAVIRFCPHALETVCHCRKPQPGMLLEIMQACELAPAQTLFVGDAETDREAARRAGISFVWAWDFFGWNLSNSDREKTEHTESTEQTETDLM